MNELEILEKYVDNNKMDYKIPEEVFEALTKAIFIHDLGKIYDNFQWKVFSKEEKTLKDWKLVREFLKDATHTEYEIRHEILSTLWSLLLLKNEEWDKKIRTAVLLHHYNGFYTDEKDLMEIVLSYEEDVKKYAEFMKNNEKDIKEILKNFLLYFEEKGLSKKYNTIISKLLEGIDFQKIDNLIERINSRDDDISELGEFFDIKNDSPDYDFLVFLGMLRRCDYSASGDVEIESVLDVEKVFNSLDSRIRKKIGASSEIWQEKLLREEHEGEIKKMLLVAPTGSGKTEFALLWAKSMGRKFIYTLPLRVALNDIYSRFKDGGPDDVKLFDETKEVSILHSTAFIEYIKERDSGADIDTETKINTSKLFSYPVMLTTPDQIFLSSLNYYGSDKLISIYPESAIVIDEIQTYNPEMAAIIIRTLEIISELKGNILIITATFPPYFKKFLDNLGVRTIDISKKGIQDVKNLSIKRHKLLIINRSVFDFENLKEDKELPLDNESEKEIKKILKTSGSKLIIVNTVSKAISLYDSLKGNEENNFYLLHSRIIEKEKSARIEEMKEKMANDEDVVLISTQIVEASVDLDFDILITEISTIDSQIQRWGRVYRKRGDEDYDKSDPNIIIFTGLDKYTSYIYDKKVLEKTVEVLKKKINGNNVSELLEYKDEIDLIEQVYNGILDNGATLRKEYEDKIEKTIKELKYFTVEKKSQAQRLFRDIAGYKIVVPQIMLESDKEEEKTFARILMEKEDMSWKQIISKMKEMGLNIADTGKTEWELKKILYDYSFTMPAYYFEKYRWTVVDHEFKGFYLLKLSENQVKDIKEYGFDKIKKELSVDEEMVKIY